MGHWAWDMHLGALGLGMEELVHLAGFHMLVLFGSLKIRSS